MDSGDSLGRYYNNEKYIDETGVMYPFHVS